MEKKIKIVPRYGVSLKDKLYLPAIYEGLKITFKHLIDNVSDSNAIDVLEYP
jgi:NADH-quinone oxidoreductase subunit I